MSPAAVAPSAPARCFSAFGGDLVIVVTNRVPLAHGQESDFEDRFRRRALAVVRAPGFIRNEVHRPRPMKFDTTRGQYLPDPSQPAFYEVKTWWRSFQDYEDWTQSAAFARAQDGDTPKKMQAGMNSIDVHEVFIESPASGNLF
jgi:heme-degrading monooxygenase HmoA